MLWDLWGRSSREIYASSGDGVFAFNGHVWTALVSLPSVGTVRATENEVFTTALGGALSDA